MQLMWLLIFLLNYYAYCNVTDDLQLDLVHVFFRHGSRTPDKIEAYPDDRYGRGDYYPLGFGQLTSIGKQKAYQLGKILRERYKCFLEDGYNPEVVYTRTTDFDRTKMSALLVLASLFPPELSDKLDDNLHWMPIPYYYEKVSNDYELIRPIMYCQTYIKELRNVLSSNYVNKLLKEHDSTMKYINEHFGKPVRTLEDAFSLHQLLNSENEMNITLPEWAASVYPDIRYLAAQLCYLENSTPILKRMNGGRILGKVINQMKARSNGLLIPKRRKLYLYSGHDNNIINILSTLNVFYPHFPDYSSAVLIELYRSRNGGNFVKVLYLKDVSSKPEEQVLPECGTLCPLEVFLRITEPYIPNNYTEECESTIPLD